jgi:peptidoglycan/LPS O-acetylase OafA/YrhL
MGVTRARIPVLDGWRAIAIGLVLWHHVTMNLYREEWRYWTQSLSQLGAFGVDIFFGLSGLLITSLLLEEHRRSGSISLSRFYTRRVFRILPPVFALLLVVGMLGLFRSPWELASCLGFFRNYMQENLAGSYTKHLWSLAVEEHFYLLWPALLVWLCRKRSGARPVAYLSIAFGLWRVFDHQSGATAHVLAGVDEHFRTDLRADSLLWGCFLAFLVDAPESRAKLQRHLNAPVVALCALATVLFTIFYSMLATLWIAMLIPVVIAGTMLHPEWRFCRVLELAPVRFLGRMSYSLYVWQQLFLTAGWLPGKAIGPAAPWNLVAAFAVAAASYFLIEKPCMKFGRMVAEQGWRVAVFGMAARPAVALD